MEMELTIPSAPPPAEMARALVMVLVAGMAMLLLASWLKRTARQRFLTMISYALFTCGAGLLLLIGVVLIVPSHHPGVQWTASAGANRAVDVAIGALFWGVVGVVYRYAWRGRIED